MAFPVIESIGKYVAVSQQTSIVIPAPIGIEKGDLLMAIVCNDMIPVSGDFYILEPGWEKLIIGGSSSVAAYSVVLWKIAEGGEGSVQVFYTGSAWAVGYQVRVSGVDIYDPFTFPRGKQVTSNNVTIDSDTTIHDDSLQFSVASFDGSDGSPFTWSAGFTKLQDDDSNQGANGVSAGIATRPIPTAGATGAASITASSTDGFATTWFNINPTQPGKLSQYTTKSDRQGTWFPTVENSTAGVPTSFNKGRWIRNGNFVTVTGYFSFTSLNGSNTTDVIFGGLPFNIANDAPTNRTMYSGQLQPQNGMEVNEVNEGGTGINAQHEIAVWGVGASKTYKLVSYIGTNSTVSSANLLYFSEFQHFSTTVEFGMQLTYFTDDP